ncbi:MAG: hypothetical protein R2726_17980 [Acidimicrobiales bacterium]
MPDGHGMAAIRGGVVRTGAGVDREQDLEQVGRLGEPGRAAGGQALAAGLLGGALGEGGVEAGAEGVAQGGQLVVGGAPVGVDERAGQVVGLDDRVRAGRGGVGTGEVAVDLGQHRREGVDEGVDRHVEPQVDRHGPHDTGRHHRARPGGAGDTPPSTCRRMATGGWSAA